MSNRLSLNVGKTNYMICAPGRKKSNMELKLCIGAQAIKEVEQCKFLGLILDNKLNWKAQFKLLSSKVAKTIGILSKARKCLGKKVLIQLYYGFMYPYFL